MILEKKCAYTDDTGQVHAIRDGLDTAPNYFDQVLKDQGGQVNLVVILDMVHKLVVNLVHHSVLHPMDRKK